jgi:hypothetical protein
MAWLRLRGRRLKRTSINLDWAAHGGTWKRCSLELSRDERAASTFMAVLAFLEAASRFVLLRRDYPSLHDHPMRA